MFILYRARRIYWGPSHTGGAVERLMIGSRVERRVSYDYAETRA